MKYIVGIAMDFSDQLRGDELQRVMDSPNARFRIVADGRDWLDAPLKILPSFSVARSGREWYRLPLPAPYLTARIDAPAWAVLHFKVEEDAELTKTPV